MLRMVAGCWVSQAIHAAAKLGIADLLEGGPRGCDTLAAATGTHAGSLYRLMRTLASLGIFAEEADGRFRLTPLADCLRDTAPGSLRAFAVLLGEPSLWQAWGGLLHSMRTGEPAFDHVFGMPHFQYFAAHPEAGRLFAEGMTSRAGAENDAIVAAYDFSPYRTVVDVGAGEGSLIAAILRSSATARGVLLDLPHVVATARARLDAEASARCDFHDGSFFDAVPSGGDLYLLKKVIHDWDDERAGAILARCAAAMSADARLLLIEPVIAPGDGASFNKLLDLLMLVWTSGGRERTEAEHAALLGAAGLRIARVIPTATPLTIIEAVPLETGSPPFKVQPKRGERR
jgi:hypothetical protein